MYEPDPYQLDQLGPADREFMIRLPFRIGMFISQSDTSGEGESDEAEKLALEMVVTSYAQDFCKSEFVQQVMNETVEWKDDWPDWSTDIHEVPGECREMMSILADKLPMKDLNAFKQNLYGIGRSVALAYREDDHKNGVLGAILQRLRFYSYQRSMKKAGVEPLHWEEFLNISSAERNALEILERSLGLREI